MRIHPHFLVVFFCGLLQAAAFSNACEYAGSNIGFVKSQTQKAIAAEDLNTSRYHAYKALNAIEKSKSQLEECGCKYAVKSLEEAFENLKKATRVKSLGGSRILLNRALENALGSLEALEQHEELHDSRYSSDVLAVNTVQARSELKGSQLPNSRDLERIIDKSLESYRTSLDKVVSSVDCKTARAYAQKVFDHCEQRLLSGKLTEAKKYYNLKTQQITAEALESLEECNQ